MTMFIGIRTTIQAGGASNFAISHTLGPTNLCIATAIAANAVGTSYTLTGNFGDALQIGAAGAVARAGITEGLLATGNRCKGILLPLGNITLTGSGAGTTGACSWYIYYIPIDAAAVVTVL